MAKLAFYVKENKDDILPYYSGVRNPKHRNELTIREYKDGNSVTYHFKALNEDLSKAHYIVVGLNPEYIKIRFYDDNEIVIDTSDINILNDETLFILTHGIKARELIKIPFTDEDKVQSITFLSKIEYMI